MTVALALRSASEQRRARSPKSAYRAIFLKTGRAGRRHRAYAADAYRENAYAYEKPRQDRQSLQTDPVGYEDDLNLYSYVGSDPLNRSDPTGQFCRGPCPRWEDIFRSIGEGISEQFASAGRVFGTDPEPPTAEDAFNTIQLAVEFAVPPGASASSRIARAIDTCCFVAGTLVDTIDGLRPIEEIEVSDLVLSRDEETGETAYKAVTDLIRRHQRIIWEVVLTGPDGERARFETTDDHPWWIAGIGWRRTEELAAGMAMVTADGRGMVIESVGETETTASTYNLTVADFETYFVGEQRVLVHNCPPGGGRRTEFSAADRAEIRQRNQSAGGGTEHCEGCGVVVERQQGPNQRGQQIEGNRSELDHRQALRDGGDSSSSNGQVLCHDCHVVKTTEENAQRRARSHMPDEKLIFELEVNDGWPPVAAESLWLEPTAHGHVVRSIPFFLPKVSYADTLKVLRLGNGRARISDWVKRSGNSTIWAYFPESLDPLPTLKLLGEAGVGWEGGGVSGYFALNLPEAVPLSRFDEIMALVEHSGDVKVVFGSLRHQE